jgi:hypothetical protein
MKKTYAFMFLLSLIIIFVIVWTISVHKNYKEYFVENGLPLDLLDTITPLPQMYFKELGHQEFVEIVRLASPSSSIDNLVGKMNNLIKTYDLYTSNIPYQLKYTYTISQDIVRVLLYRDGKMYGFLLDYNKRTGIAVPVAFILEQDIMTYTGIDKINVTRQYEEYPINNNILVGTINEIDTTLQKQSSAIYQDRGLAASNFF